MGWLVALLAFVILWLCLRHPYPHNRGVEDVECELAAARGRARRECNRLELASWQPPTAQVPLPEPGERFTRSRPPRACAKDMQPTETSGRGGV
jgi:hypothetical protein